MPTEAQISVKDICHTFIIPNQVFAKFEWNFYLSLSFRSNAAQIFKITELLEDPDNFSEPCKQPRIMERHFPDRPESIDN